MCQLFITALQSAHEEEISNHRIAFDPFCVAGNSSVDAGQSRSGTPDSGRNNSD